MQTSSFQHIDACLQSLRFAARSLRRSPAFAIAAIVTLGLGIGATTSVFALINAVLLRPLPWADPDRVGIVWPTPPSGERTWASFPELQELRREIPSLQSVSGFTDLRPRLLVNGVGYEIQALAVSHQFFRTLGVAPALGRDFTVDDDRAGSAPAAILSDGFWRSQFGGDPNVVGRRILLNEHEYSILGVLPSTFSVLPASSVLPERVDVWLPLEPHLASRERNVRFLHVVARLNAGATFEQADQELHAYARRVTGEFAGAYRDGEWRFTIDSFKDDVLQKTRPALYMIFSLVVLVLLMACANVANLLLARGEVRRSELAVRTALGAGPARLAGELLAEALLLALAGSVIGLGLAMLAPGVLRALDPGALPRLDEAHTDARVVAFVGGLLLLSTVIFAAAPLLERVRLKSPSGALARRDGGRTRRSATLGKALVVLQTALATTVLITTFFLTGTFARLQQSDLGFTTENLLTARITLPPSYGGPKAVQFFESARAAVEQVSGVTGAAGVTQLPLSGAMLGSTFYRDQAIDAEGIDADLRGITPKYFQVIGTPVVHGRSFSDMDAASAPPVAIVDESFARKLSPDGNVVGRRIRWFRQPDVEIEIVGIVRPVRHRGPGDAARETVYRPHRQYPRNSMFLTVRTSTDPASMVASVRAAVQSVDPSQPFADVSTMRQRVDMSISRARTSLMLASVLAGLALTLGLVGLYGVLSFGVAQRLREFGVRLSLGSTPADVQRLVLREGVTLTFAGVTVGVVSAATVVSAIHSMLYEASVTDVRQYVLGTSVVMLSSIVAFWIPARRASATDPLVALRAE